MISNKTSFQKTMMTKNNETIKCIAFKNSLFQRITANNDYLKNKYDKDERLISHKNTLFILDWDDTLFPTSWSNANNIDLIDPNAALSFVNIFKLLDETIFIFLTNIQQCGKVIIITNATKQWVNVSSIVIPKSNEIIKNLSIISARDDYIGITTNVNEWKIYAFKQFITKEFRYKSLMNVISIGDGIYERDALMKLYHLYPNKIKYLKSIKYKTSPSLNNLIEQLDTVNNAIIDIFKTYSQICKIFTE